MSISRRALLRRIGAGAAAGTVLPVLGPGSFAATLSAAGRGRLLVRLALRRVRRRGEGERSEKQTGDDGRQNGGTVHGSHLVLGSGTRDDRNAHKILLPTSLVR